MNHTPKEFVVDGDGCVGECFAKADDFRTLADGGKEFWVSLGELNQCFADDCEFAVHGRTDQTATAVIIKVDVGHSSLNGVARIREFCPIGPGIPGHGPAP